MIARNIHSLASPDVSGSQTLSGFRSTARPLWFLSLLAASTVAGCGAKKDDKPKAADPDLRSGPDAKRSGALTIEKNKLASDEVDFDKADQTDWKAVNINGTGVMTVELHWENTSSDINVDVFDSLGSPIAGSPQANPAQTKKLICPVDKEGNYYIRVQAPKAGSGSAYTVIAKYDQPPPAPATPPPAAPPPEAAKPKKEKKAAPAATAEPKPKKEKKGGSEVQGRIVSSYREGSSMVIYLDKGGSAGIKAGDSGTILEGTSGGNVLEGGSFTITQVIDDSKSIGKATIHSVGKNVRVNIMVH